MNRRFIGHAICIALAVALLSLSSTAATVRRTTRPKAQATKPKVKEKTAPTTNPYDAALKEVDADTQALATAQAAYDKIYTPLHDQFEASADMTAANATLNTATAAFQAEQAAIEQQLSSDPAYVTATNKKQAIQATIESLRESGTATPQQMTDAANEDLADGEAISQLRQACESKDPNFALTKAALVDAASKVAALNAQFEQSIRTSTDVAASKQALDDAQTKLTVAQTNLAALEHKPPTQVATRKKT